MTVGVPYLLQVLMNLEVAASVSFVLTGSTHRPGMEMMARVLAMIDESSVSQKAPAAVELRHFETFLEMVRK